MRAVIVLAVLVSLPATAWAGTCPLCREALQSGGSPGLVRGFYWSILLIGGVAFGLLTALLLFVRRLWRAPLDSALTGPDRASLGMPPSGSPPAADRASQR